MWYRFNRWLFKAWLWLQCRYRTEGREHLPQPPYIVIANHVSAADVPLVGIAIPPQVHFMAKEEMLHFAPVGAWVRSVGGFFVKRGEADRSALRAALELLARGKVVGLFVEGTRSPDGRLQPLEEGAAFLALQARVPVVPVAVIGTHRIMPKGARFPRVARVRMRIGPPIELPDSEGRITRRLRHEVSRRFFQSLANLLPEDQKPLTDQAVKGEPSLKPSERAMTVSGEVEG